MRDVESLRSWMRIDGKKWEKMGGNGKWCDNLGKKGASQ
jgi:hypothetical protein